MWFGIQLDIEGYFTSLWQLKGGMNYFYVGYWGLDLPEFGWKLKTTPMQWVGDIALCSDGMYMPVNECSIYDLKNNKTIVIYDYFESEGT